MRDSAVLGMLLVVGALQATACGGKDSDANSDESTARGDADDENTDDDDGDDESQQADDPDDSPAPGEADEATDPDDETTADDSDAPTAPDDAAGTDDVEDDDARPSQSPPTAEGGLTVEGNRILLPDGTPFHGRGANFTDTRSCNACTYLQADPQGVNRWADELFDNWGANFARFTLTAFDSDEGYRQQWASLIDDADYAQDVYDNVSHMTSKPGVYVMVTLFTDPSLTENNDDYDSEWPTAESIPVYELLAEIFADNPKVLFGLTNEPHGPEDRNPELAQRYLDAIDAIRAVEENAGVAEHIVVVQAPQQWARDLGWFVENPIDRSNVAYEVHPYNPEEDFDWLLVEPSNSLPLIIGEYGPTPYQDDQDIRALWELAQRLEIPHLAWIFHHRCPPNLLEDTAEDGCGLSEESAYDFPRTDWGDLLYEYLQTPW